MTQEIANGDTGIHTAFATRKTVTTISASGAPSGPTPALSHSTSAESKIRNEWSCAHPLAQSCEISPRVRASLACRNSCRITEACVFSFPRTTTCRTRQGASAMAVLLAAARGEDDVVALAFFRAL
eukprot:6185545-Pleurochrysis_carterae.AAC.2